MNKQEFPSMQRLIPLTHLIVFISASLVVGSIFYEGLTLTWYSFVPFCILAMDATFIIATILNLLHYRKNRALFYINLFSAVGIVAAIVMKVLSIEYPQWTILLWDFYILYLYGFLVIRRR
jgi:nicotinamide riboside transporter PnuC